MDGIFLKMLKKETIPKTSLAALKNAANDAILLKQSREFKSTTSWTKGTAESSGNQPNKSNIPKRRTEDEIVKTPRPRPAEDFNGVEEQKFYTEENLSLNLKRNRQEREGQQRNELPPPQKCRLSCPLPPAEFCSQELNEFRSNYRSPKVRFSSLPMQFLPEPQRTQARSENHTQMEPSHSSGASNEKAPATSGVSLDQLQLAGTITDSKNYANIMPPKFQPGEPLKKERPKMKALLFEPTTLTLSYDAVEAPIKIFKDEVLVQVAYSGVCGTDLFITEGKLSCGNSPVILGHEISGTVYAAGSEVEHVKSGDKIAVDAYTACCVCRYCSRGLFSACLKEGLNNSLGISKNGGWAEFVVVKKSQVHRIPDQLELDQAALIQPLSCILSAMSKLKIFHEMDILVQGLGLSGCLWTSVLHSQGYKNVFASDRRIQRRLQFKSLDTNYLLVPPEDIGKHNVDLVVECTGSPTSIEKSFNILNPKGQMCFFRKPYPTTHVRCIPYDIIQKEITIIGNAGNAFHFSKAIDLATTMGRRYLDFEKLGVKTFNLENFREAFQQKKAEEVSKIIFKLDS